MSFEGGHCSFHFRLAYWLLLFLFFIFSFFKYWVKYELYNSDFCRNMQRKIQICFDIRKNILLILFISFFCLVFCSYLDFRNYRDFQESLNNVRAQLPVYPLSCFCIIFGRKILWKFYMEDLSKRIYYLRSGITLQTLGNSIEIYWCLTSVCWSPSFPLIWMHIVVSWLELVWVGVFFSCFAGSFSVLNYEQKR